MNKTRKRSFSALLFVLASLFVLVLSLGIFCACGSESASTEENGANDSASGSTWYYGDKEPAQDLGREGDYYLNTETLASYVKEGKTWRAAANGEVGSWYYGTAEPNANLGSPNDFYLNTKTGELYQKSAGGWGDPILTLQGEKGRDGVVWFSGDKAPEEDDPALKDAQPGDFYLDYSKFDVYQLKADKTWGDPLGTIKGDPGDDAKDPVQFFNGDGEPDAEVSEKAQVGDLYIGQFTGSDGSGAGSRLYRYNGTTWDVLMESIKENQLDIYSLDQLKAFGQKVANGDSYEGKEVHLKENIDFETGSVLSRRAVNTIDGAVEWEPIGTSKTPFKGTFDGEGHIISNFSAKTTDDIQAAGFFGYVDGATIEHLHFVGATVTASGDGAVAAVVVGQATGEVAFNNVTVDAKCEAQDSATVGGLVGSLAGSNEETKVTVEGSSFEGSGAKDLIGDKGAVENVTVTGSVMADENGGKTEWDDQGNTKVTHPIAAAKSIVDLIGETNASGGELGMVLTENVEFDASMIPAEEKTYKWGYALGRSKDTSTQQEQTRVDLTIDLNGHDLTIKSYQHVDDTVTYFTIIDANGIRVTNGSSLKITNSKETGTLHLIANGGSPIYVTGKHSDGTRSSVTFENVNVECKSTYMNYRGMYFMHSPAIKASSGAVVNFLGGTHISAYDNESNEIYHLNSGNYIGRKLTKEAYIVSVEAGSSADYHTILNLDGATVEVGGLVTPFVALGKYTDINFKSGTITARGAKGSSVLAIDAGDSSTSGKVTKVKECGTIRMTGGTINLEGQAEEPDLKNTIDWQYVQAITDFDATYGMIYVSGGVINVKPTSGGALAIGANKSGAYGNKEYHVGGGVTINLSAADGAKAYAIGCASAPAIYVYQDLNINILGSEENNVGYYVSSVNNTQYRNSTPQIGAEMGVVDERSTPMPENKK